MDNQQDAKKNVLQGLAWQSYNAFLIGFLHYFLLFFVKFFLKQHQLFDGRSENCFSEIARIGLSSKLWIERGEQIEL
jgi:hypothetical protein